MKSITKLAWNVSEEEYREHHAYSYSILAKFDREGFRKINTLYDKVESQSLTFGSATDIAVLSGSDEFKDKFVKYTLPSITPSLEGVIKQLYNKYGSKYESLDEIPDEIILSESINFQARYKDSTKLALIRSEGGGYYEGLVHSTGKTMLSAEDYERVFRCVIELKNNPNIGIFFRDPPSGYEAVNQLKFITTYDGSPVKCMIDRIIVDHSAKKIQLIDLKTTSGYEEDFEESFVKWRYYIQAQLYTYIVNKLIKEDEYFKDFKIEPFYFIVINKYTLSPIAWRYKNNFSEVSTIKDGELYRNWRDILKELRFYLLNPNIKYSQRVVQSGGILDINF